MYYCLEFTETGDDGKASLFLPADAEGWYILAVKPGVGFDYFEWVESPRPGVYTCHGKPIPSTLALTLGPCTRGIVRAQNSRGRPIAGLTYRPAIIRMPGTAFGRPLPHELVTVIQEGCVLPESLREAIGARNQSLREELVRAVVADGEGYYSIRLGPGRFRLGTNGGDGGRREIVVGSEAEMIVDIADDRPKRQAPISE